MRSPFDESTVLFEGIRLLCRAKIADGIRYFFFFITDGTEIHPITILNTESTREGHSNRMARYFEYKHLERSDQEVKKSLIRRIEAGHIF